MELVTAHAACLCPDTRQLVDPFPSKQWGACVSINGIWRVQAGFRQCPVTGEPINDTSLVPVSGFSFQAAQQK